ncbi:RNA-directed DNA polymerase, eukaryota [Tanacetum coccineum]
MASVNPSLVRSLWGSANKDFLVGDAVGLSGGTLLMWDSSIFARDEKSRQKEELWLELESLMNSKEAIWILFGDFNMVRICEERLGSNFVEWDARSFNNFIVNKGLEDLAIGGRRFTGFNSTEWDTKAEEGCLTSTDRLKREEYLMDYNFLKKKKKDTL